MKPSEKNALLQAPLFAGIPVSRAEDLLRAEGVSERSFAAGETVFSETDFSRAIGVVVRGAARVEKRGGGKSVIMSTLERSGTFGMAALFDERPVFPTVITATRASTVVFLSREWLTAAFQKEPRLAENYIRLLSARIHFLNEKITTLTRSGSKLQRYLLNEYRLHGQENRVTLSYNMAELARVLGIGRTTLYRELSDLEEAGIIKKNGKTVTVLKLEELS